MTVKGKAPSVIIFQILTFSCCPQEFCLLLHTNDSGDKVDSISSPSPLVLFAFLLLFVGLLLSGSAVRLPCARSDGIILKINKN
jgi:hypothetical protein